MIVVSDTGPLHYLALIGEIEILPSLFGQVNVPRSVATTELSDPATPSVLRAMFASTPTWLIVHPDPPSVEKPLAGLGAGELHAISLALEMKAELFLCDDLAARRNAIALGISVMGTLGLIDEGGHRNILNFDRAIDQLVMATNFRHTPALIGGVRLRHWERVKRG